MINTSQHNLEPISDPFDWEQVVKYNAQLNGRRVFEDCLGLCRFQADDINLTVLALSAATGFDIKRETAMIIGKRIVNLMRIFNIKNGISAELDKPSLRYCSTPVDGPVKGRSIALVFDNMKERYYELMGWDKKTGKPLIDTLKKLGLSQQISDVDLIYLDGESSSGIG